VRCRGRSSGRARAWAGRGSPPPRAPWIARTKPANARSSAATTSRPVRSRAGDDRVEVGRDERAQVDHLAGDALRRASRRRPSRSTPRGPTPRSSRRRPPGASRPCRTARTRRAGTGTSARMIDFLSAVICRRIRGLTREGGAERSGGTSTWARGTHRAVVLARGEQQPVGVEAGGRHAEHEAGDRREVPVEAHRVVHRAAAERVGGHAQHELGRCVAERRPVQRCPRYTSQWKALSE
jgi:hypothetical protein